ncbi:MAG: amidohydrolase [Chitinispirillaceae bacterium]|nr:amidohydrolase [Chitinispirillaceae bacterium]
MIDPRRLTAIVEEVYPRAVRLRRTIHAHPELSGSERRTASLAHAELKRLRCAPRWFLGRTAVVGRIKNGKGRTVVLRADMDALPIEEMTGLPYASKNRGVMHACGHDLHTAVLLGAAHALVRLREAWRGTVVLLFQPSEEMEPGGAIRLLKQGAFPKDAHAVFGLHVNPEHRTGTIGLKSGSDFAGVLNFTVRVTGMGGHAAAPKATVNPILAAANMISGLSRLAGSRVAHKAVIAVGAINAGSRSNIIPDQVTFCGTVRSHSKKEEQAIRKSIRRAVTKEARRAGTVTAVTFEESYPPNFNDKGILHRMERMYGRLLGRANVIRRGAPVFYAEDFAYYQRKAPGLYAHLGVTPRRTTRLISIHNARFSPDETAMKTGMLAHLGFVLEMTG